MAEAYHVMRIALCRVPLRFAVLFAGKIALIFYDSAVHVTFHFDGRHHRSTILERWALIASSTFCALFFFTASNRRFDKVLCSLTRHERKRLL